MNKRKISKPLIWLFIFILVFLIGRASVPVEKCPPPKAGEILWINEKEIVARINAVRKENGLRELTINPFLEGSAQLKADDMAEKDYFEHDLPNGNSTFIFFRIMNYDYRKAGENLAKEFRTAEGVVNGWLTSKSHKDIILDPSYREIGVGQAKDIIVAHFGRR